MAKQKKKVAKSSSPKTNLSETLKQKYKKTSNDYNRKHTKVVIVFFTCKLQVSYLNYFLHNIANIFHIAIKKQSLKANKDLTLYFSYIQLNNKSVMLALYLAHLIFYLYIRKITWLSCLGKNFSVYIIYLLQMRVRVHLNPVSLKCTLNFIMLCKHFSLLIVRTPYLKKNLITYIYILFCLKHKNSRNRLVMCVKRQTSLLLNQSFTL